MTIERILNRQAFEEMWRNDQLAEDERKAKTYKAPDGELFRIAYTRDDGTVVSDSGRWFSPEEFRECEVAA